jgi:uncharacterized Fe-S radical SAM superfamily protein PflX
MRLMVICVFWDIMLCAHSETEMAQVGASSKGGKNVLIMKKTLWNNNLNFVNDVPTKYINFILTVLIVLD